MALEEEATCLGVYSAYLECVPSPLPDGHGANHGDQKRRVKDHPTS